MMSSSGSAGAPVMSVVLPMRSMSEPTVQVASDILGGLGVKEM